MAKRSGLSLLALILVLVGGINWGLVGVMNLDLVAMIFGAGSTLASIIYSLVGLSALYMLFTEFK